jgi:hypothetical protein
MDRDRHERRRPLGRRGGRQRCLGGRSRLAAVRPAGSSAMARRCRGEAPNTSRPELPATEPNGVASQSRAFGPGGDTPRIRCTRTRPRPHADARVTAFHGTDERVAIDAATHAEEPTAGPDPPPRRLAAAGEVVLHALGDLLLVVCELVDRRALLSDRQHGVRPGPRTAICGRNIRNRSAISGKRRGSERGRIAA